MATLPPALEPMGAGNFAVGPSSIYAQVLMGNAEDDLNRFYVELAKHAWDLEVRQADQYRPRLNVLVTVFTALCVGAFFLASEGIASLKGSPQFVVVVLAISELAVLVVVFLMILILSQGGRYRKIGTIVPDITNAPSVSVLAKDYANELARAAAYNSKANLKRRAWFLWTEVFLGIAFLLVVLMASNHIVGIWNSPNEGRSGEQEEEATEAVGSAVRPDPIGRTKALPKAGTGGVAPRQEGHQDPVEEN